MYICLVFGSKFQDNLSILSKFTWKKGLNATRVWSSYYLSRFTGKPIQWGFPISVAIEPTTSCNLRCPECPSGNRSFTRPTGMLEQAFYQKTIDELASHISYLTFYFQGEPYLNPHFLDMVKYAATRKIYTATSTNAHYLNNENARKTIESGLNRLIISIDGTTQETYENYRIGGQLNKVLEGTRTIIRWKKQLKASTPYVIFQFLVVRPNEHQIEDANKLAKELGVDAITFKTAQVYDHHDGHPLIPLQDKYSRYQKTADGNYTIKNKLLNHCWRLWNSCVITWDGTIVPCCFDKDAKHQLGSLKENSFRHIWQGTSYQRFRSALLRSRKEIDICANCTEGTH